MNIFAISRLDKSIKLNSVQYIRIIAALSVIFFHIEQGINKKYWVMNEYLELFSWGQKGVSLFFCISGFVIAYSSYIRPKKMFKFLYSRIARIYPAYLFTALIFIFSLIFLPNKNINPNEILNTIFFNFGISGGYVYVGWTLFYEMIFYTIFSTLSNNFKSIAKNQLFIYLISIVLIFSYLTSSKYITDFAVGIVVFLIKLFPLKKYKSIVFLTLILSFVAGLFFNPLSFFLGITLIIILSFEEFLSPLFNAKFILFLADSSYAIYLAQVLTISASLKISRFITLNTFDNYYFMYLISFLISIISTIYLGILIRQYIEIPSFNFLKKISLTIWNY